MPGLLAQQSARRSASPALSSQVIVRLAERWMPDPFIFAILLTLLTLGMGLLVTPHGLMALLGFWGQGFWAFLEFAMQMALILVTGHALASAPPIRALLQRLVDVPQTPAQAIGLVSLGALLGGWLNWGFGLIVGALLARDVGISCRRRSLEVDYPLLGAAGYTGMVIWHGGLSGSAPLTVAQERHALVETLGTLPLGQTVFSAANLWLTLALMIAIPLTLIRLHPSHPETCRLEPRPLPPPPSGSRTPAQFLEDSPWLAWMVVLMGGIWLLEARPSLGINTVNFVFMLAGLALHGSARSYSQAVAEATPGVSGILLQFPFYAGIMGIMQSSGLIAWVAQLFVQLAQGLGGQSFYWLTFLSAGLVNLFVPSGGGQWIVQGPIVVEAAQALQLSQARTVMAVAYGDQWSNMLQPFWALPLLATTGLQARQLIAYTAPVFLVSGALFSLSLLLFR